jgi:hypothetical protein
MGGILGGLLGILGLGGNQQATAATNAANQASGAQNQLIQQSILPLLNQENAGYQQNQVPLEGGLSKQYGGLLSGLNAGQLGQNYVSGLQNPNAGGVNPQASAQQLIGYGSQPQNTQLAGLTPQVIQQLLSGGVLGNGQSGVGGQVLGQQLGQMTQGLSPQLQQQGLGQQQQGFDQQLSDIRNMLGSGAEVGSMINQLGYGNDQARAGLEANYAGQSQGLMNQGAQNAFGTAQGLTQQQNNSGLQALGAGSGLDAQTLALLQQAYGIGNMQQQQTLGNLGAAYGAANQGLGSANQYVQQGQNSMNSALGGFSGLAGQYGTAAGNAANQAQNAYNQQSQQFGGLMQAGMTALAAGA